MRDLIAEELGHVYGAGGGGRRAEAKKRGTHSGRRHTNSGRRRTHSGRRSHSGRRGGS